MCSYWLPQCICFPIGSYYFRPADTIHLSLDAPSTLTGTGSYVVADGEDVALVRATLLDSVSFACEEVLLLADEINASF